jgi:DNA-binding GntR family transcriptional regulator
MQQSSAGPRIRLYDATGERYPGDGLPLTLPEHIRQSLEREIIEGRLTAGSRLAEDELGARLGVSRTPVREAMRMLEGQGLVLRRRGRGSFVAERTSLDEARAIYEIRYALEGHLVANATTRIGDSELSLIARLSEEFHVLAREPGDAASDDLTSLDSDLHWAIYNAAQSDLTSLVAAYWGRLQRELYGRVYAGPAREGRPVTLYAQQHSAIVDGMRQRNPAAAQTAMIMHLKTGWESVQSSYAAVHAASADSQ